MGTIEKTAGLPATTERTKMNLQHGFYSTNTSINPDCVMVSNIEIKNAVLNHGKDIRDVLDGKMVSVGVTDLVCYLLDCVLPHAGHLIEPDYQLKATEYHGTRAFQAIRRYSGEKTLKELQATVSSFR